MIVIDGSYGEGGGQILRTAVGLSAVLGFPVRIINIRAKRKKPGLRPQHLTAIKVLQALTGAKVKGLQVGSHEIEFVPGPIRAGFFNFDIGTAGSISLLLQAVLPVIAFAPGPVEITIKGGTDVKMAPLIDYMRFILINLLKYFKYNINIKLIKRGHYPRGGGIVKVIVSNPPRKLRNINLINRGKIERIEGISHCVRLPSHVAERQARMASKIIEKELGIKPLIKIEYYKKDNDPHLGPGSGIVLWAVFSNSIIGADSLGERGIKAEEVGKKAALKLIEDIKSGAAVDRHASDMLPVYMALAEGISEYTGSILTTHTQTIFWLINKMIPQSKIMVNGSLGEPFYASIKGIGLIK